MAFETEEGILKLIVYVAVVSDGKILLVQYDAAPNPDRGGWWVPAPEMRYGQGPDELAKEVLAELGIGDCAAELVETESFTTPGGLALHVPLSRRSATAGCSKLQLRQVGMVQRRQHAASRRVCPWGVGETSRVASIGG